MTFWMMWKNSIWVGLANMLTPIHRMAVAAWVGPDNPDQQGVVDAKQFATIVQTKGKFGIGPQGPLPDYIPDLINVIQNIASRLTCP